MYIRPKLLFFN